MTQRIQPLRGPFDNGQPLDSDGGLRAPPGLGPWGRFWWWLKFWLFVKTARLRFIAILVAIGLVIVKWNWLMAYYEHYTRVIGLSADQHATSSDTEFWCPMHPTVVRDHPDKCPICAMPLSARKKGTQGDGEAIPAGVVRRVNLSPWRVAQAGLQTSEVGYRELTREIRTVGYVEFDETRLMQITNWITGKSRIQKLHVNVTGQTFHKGDPVARLYSPELVVTMRNLLDAHKAGEASLERIAHDRLRLWGISHEEIAEVLKTGRPVTHITIRAPIGGHVIRKYQVEGAYVDEGAPLYDVADLSTVWVEAQVYEDEIAFLKDAVKKKLKVTATVKSYPNRKFKGEVAFVHPHLDARTRTLKVRFNIKNPHHQLDPGMYATVSVKIPTAELEVFGRVAGEDLRNGTALDGVAHVLGRLDGPAPGPGLQPLLQAAVQKVLLKQKQVLAVPENAVIDTGNHKFVYREAWPGVYDCLEVQLGPRSGGYYPVARGLEFGDRVVTAGSFLVDAETKLTGGLGSTYFGASGGASSEHSSATSTARPSMIEDEDVKAKAVLAKLSRVDRRLAETQGYCPIQEKRLGTMGPPVKITVKGQPVFLCCKGCVNDATEDPEQTLTKVEAMKARVRGGARWASAGTKEQRLSAKDAKIKAAFDKLPAADRRLAEAQRFCAVQGKASRLGLMGMPIKVMIQGQPVFLCCESCREDALANPQQTLAAVERLKKR